MREMFGNENTDTKYAWKAKFEQAQRHNQGLQQRIHELNELIKDYEEALNKLIKAKKELEEENQYFAKVIEEKEQQLKQFEGRGQTMSTNDEKIEELQNRIALLQRENDMLKRDLAESSRTVSTHAVNQYNESLPSRLIESTQKMLMRELESDDERFTSAFVEFVEALTQAGDPETKILATLIKYGGKGPQVKLKEKAMVEQFEFHLAQLVRKGYLKEEADEIMINSSIIKEVEEVNLSELTLPELFEYLKDTIKATDIQKIPRLLENFRDEIQDRDVPATTIFFSIRKIAEAIRSGKIGKKEVLEEVDVWAAKLLGGNP
ncbi:MAG: hypothetical protein D6732_01810 [Methanobacteriota archaeon]|nr:MAG: hypothetical protein D6732_01810 [Euryarchaeota archaeon]